MPTIKGIDCDTPITTSVADQFIGLGLGFIMRYINRMTAAEAQILSAAGLLIGCVFETTATRAQGGAANGQADGAAAFQCAQTLNMPTTAAIIFAVDFDAQASDMEAIAEYLTAAKAQIGAYMLGVYGSYAVVEAMEQRGIPQILWQTYAWSNGQVPVHATLYQYQNDQTVAGVSVDLDEAYSTVGLWNYNGGDIVTQDQFNQMMAAYLANLATLPPSAFSQAARTWAEGQGIIKGDQNGNKEYMSFCTREQMAIFLQRLYTLLSNKGLTMSYEEFSKSFEGIDC